MNKSRQAWSSILLACAVALGAAALSGTSTASAQCEDLRFERGPYDTFSPIFEKLYYEPWFKDILGCRQTGYEFVGSPRGAWVNFENGIVTYSTDVKRAHVVYGAIAVLYKVMNLYGTAWESFGYPITDELEGANGGRYSLFQHGGIWWQGSTGATHAVYGDIFQSYMENGAEATWGYPQTEEVDADADYCLFSDGRMQWFGHYRYACWRRETREVLWY